MKKILLFTFIILFASIGVSNADQYVPEFDKMQNLYCEITETIYNNDNTQVSQTDYHRLFRLDDGTNTIYIQKERPSRIYYYGADKIQYREQSMTDDYIMISNVTIDRTNNLYNATSQITYDNMDYGSRRAVAEGNCKIAN